jgi:hypothetical protein
MDLKEIGCEDMDWVHLAHDRVQRWVLLNTVTNIRVPQKSGKFLAS